MSPSTASGSIRPGVLAGSSTLTSIVRPATAIGPTATPRECSTSGTAPSAVASDGLRPPPPNWLAAMIRSPSSDELTLSSKEVFSDPANAVNIVTTPMPIVSADAVAAVRRGDRDALR